MLPSPNPGSLTHSHPYPTTPYPLLPDGPGRSARCLVTYYGYTNETCWYETRGDEKEAGYSGALGHHLVEAHWKYFTVDVKDQYECDRRAQRHYEFLLKRCSPRHYLPVVSVYRCGERSS